MLLLGDFSLATDWPPLPRVICLIPCRLKMLTLILDQEHISLSLWSAAVVGLWYMEEFALCYIIIATVSCHSARKSLKQGAGMRILFGIPNCKRVGRRGGAKGVSLAWVALSWWKFFQTCPSHLIQTCLQSSIIVWFYFASVSYCNKNI